MNQILLSLSFDAKEREKENSRSSIFPALPPFTSLQTRTHSAPAELKQARLLRCMNGEDAMEKFQGDIRSSFIPINSCANGISRVPLLLFKEKGVGDEAQSHRVVTSKEGKEKFLASR